MEGRNEPLLPPGFRFHPTDEELIVCYLIKKVEKNNFSVRAIGDVDLNKSEPWELPEKAKMGEKEWYFFTLRDRKYPTGMRTNRATEAGYWKATGKDRDIMRSGTTALVGAKKTLVFYRGRAPKGVKTNWIMHEYRLEGEAAYLHNCRTSKESEWVVCRIFQKSPGGKKGMYRDAGRTKSSFCDDVDTHSSLPPLLESPPFTGNDDSGAEAAESSALRGSDQMTGFPMFHEKQGSAYSSLTQQLAGWSSGIARGESSNMATSMNSPQAVLDAGAAFRFPLSYDSSSSYYDMPGTQNALMAKLRQDLEIPATRPSSTARSCKMEQPSYMDQQQPFPSNYSSGHGSLDNWVNESLGYEQATNANNNNSSSFSESGLREILDSSNSSGLYRTGSSVDLEEAFWPY